jgi:hypothetical protein
VEGARVSAALSRWAEALGVAGIIGIGFAVCAVALYVGTLLPVEKHLVELGKEKARLELVRAGQVRNGSVGGDVAVAERLRDFYRILAREESIGELLETVDAIGREHGVVLRQGSYRFSAEAGSRFGRYEVTYTAQSAYFQARLFLRDVLRELPMISLDGVSFQRQQTTAGATELSARFSMLVRRER